MSRIRVHGINGLAGGEFLLKLKGKNTDAAYVSERLEAAGDVTVNSGPTDPGTEGIFCSIIARGIPANPLTREKVIEILRNDPMIEVMFS